MAPGMYKVRCHDVVQMQRGRYLQVVLTFEVAEEAWNDGTELKQWYNLKAQSGMVSPHTKYARAWELAVGREIQVGDNMDPEIFKGKCFMAYVGYSSKDTEGNYDQANAETKKDNRDFLRIHSLERLDDWREET